MKAGRPPGYDGRCRDLTEAERAAQARRGPAAVAAVPDAGHRGQQLHRPGAGRGQRRVVHDLGLRDRPIGRQPGVLPRERGGRRRHGDHPRHPGRGPPRHDAPGARAARGARVRRARCEFAHLPLLVGADRAKLSKRHGAVAIEDFRDRGYLADALVNYLALLGWAPADGREVLARDELLAEFDLDRVTHSAAFFDYKKLDWLNGEYIRALSARRARGRRSSSARPRRWGDRVDRGDGARGRPNRTGAGRDDRRRSSTRPSSSSSPKTTFARRRRGLGGRARRRPSARREVLDAVIAHLETCEWTVELTDVRPPIEALGIKPRQGDAAALHRGRRSPRRAPAVRRDPPARAGADAGPARGRPGIGSDRLPKTAQAKIGSPIRGWCNR